MPDVTISRRGADRLRAGHVWIYRSDILDAEASAGDIVRVRTERRPVGWALWSDQSQIPLRLVDRRGELESFDEAAWLAGRLEAAVAYRETLDLDGDAYRLVHGEADGLPGLIVDRYAGCLVVQALCQGMDRRLPSIVRWLVDRLSPEGILARNDPKVRALEGLPQVVEVLHGQVPDRVAVREGTVTRQVDPRAGQKTGLFLDQRENHRAVAALARGRALDAFTYHGGFALALAPACETVLAIDSSAAAVETARATAAANGLGNVEARTDNVFDALRMLEGEGRRFDTVVLDPPAFAKQKASVDRAAAAYKEINLRAMKLLAPGGVLATFSCSYHVDAALFDAIIASAAADARASMVLVDRRIQAVDHPVLVGVPESSYLKGLILRRSA